MSLKLLTFKLYIMKTKQLIVLFIAVLMASLSFGQAGDEGFNYKALITDNGSALANQSVNIKFTILENGTTSVYQESLTATTDANGIVSVSIGEGTVVSGNFNTINWANDQSLKVEIDTGSGYQDYGTNPLKYVPTAKYADTAGNVFSGDFNDLSNVPAGLSDGDDVNDADHSITNELQTISKTGSTVTLSDGGGSFTDAVNDADHSTTNEIQHLSISGNQISLSNNGGSVTIPSQSDADFYKANTTNPPSSINDDIYTNGKVGWD